MSIVTLALTKNHMNVDTDADDELIQLYIDAAEEWFEDFTGRKLDTLDPVPARLRRGVMELAAFYYEQREAASFGVTIQLAPFGVMSVAERYRESWFGEDVDDAA